MRVFFIAIAGLLFTIDLLAQVTVDKTRLNENFQSQEYEEAAAYLRPFFIRDTGNISLNTWLGYTYYMLDEYKTAKTFYDRLYRQDSLNITANQYLAIINYNNEPEASLNYYYRLNNLQPGRTAHLRKIAELWSRKNNPDSAISYYETAYLLGANDYRNGLGLATQLLEKKVYLRADSIIDAGLARDSMNESLLRLRVKSAYDSKNYEGAISSGEKLLQMHVSSITPVAQLVNCYYSLKRYEDCIRVCEYAEDEKIITESIYFYKAKSFMHLKQYDKSNELLRQCLSMAISDNAEMYYYSLGENYEALKKYRTAIASYDTGYYLFKEPVLLYNIGRIYDTDIMNPAQGRKYYQRYLNAAMPKNDEEKKAIDYVRRRMNSLPSKSAPAGKR